MANRILRSTLAAFLILSSLGTPLAQAEFDDLYPNHPNATAIGVLVEQEVLEGYPDGTFKPDQDVNRAEAVKIILLGLDIPVDESSTSALVFDDVIPGAWYVPYISTAYDIGMIEGYPDGFFRPEQTVNKAEAVKMVVEVLGISLEQPSEDPFPDVDEELWFAIYALYAKDFNLAPPESDGLWHPADPISRGEISELVYRMQLVLDEEEPFQESTNWHEQSFRSVSFTMKVPFNWGYKVDGIAAAWLLDVENGQLSSLSPYENGATLLMTRYTNGASETAEELFDSLEANLSYEIERDTIAGYPALIVDRDEDLFYKEWYLYFPNDTLVHLVGLRGNGDFAPYLEVYLDEMVESIEYDIGAAHDYTVEELTASLYSLILVDGMGMDMLSLIPTLELLETDPVGVGTGPVDYYYFPEANLTIKYERSYDVILGVQKGRTTEF